MDWKLLNDENMLESISSLSVSKPQLIYKHSRRCGLSSMVLTRLERNGLPEDVDWYFLDIIDYRNISNKVAELFDVWHESPQVLLIVNKECIYDESHMGINMAEILEQVNQSTIS